MNTEIEVTKMELEIGLVVELVEPVSVMYRHSPKIEMIFHPGVEGVVVQCPPTLEDLIVIDVEGWHPLAVYPNQIRATAEIVHIEVVTEEEMEAE